MRSFGFHVDDRRRDTCRRTQIQNETLPGVILSAIHSPCHPHREENIEEGNDKYAVSQGTSEKPVVFPESEGNRRKERRAVNPEVHGKGNPEKPRTAGRRINDQSNAQRRRGPCHISDDREKNSPEAKGRIPLRPDFHGVRNDQDQRADHGQPVIALRSVRGASAAPQLHRKSRNQKQRDEILIQKLGNHSYESFPGAFRSSPLFSHNPVLSVKAFCHFLPYFVFSSFHFRPHVVCFNG